MPKPVFLFAPGAGAPSSHPWMKHWVSLLQELGSVHTFDYHYMQDGRLRPDPLPGLIEAHLTALGKIQKSSQSKIDLVGKSMGSRVGCHVSLEAPVNFVVCLGYPLCAAGDRTKLRDKVLLAMKTPVLFVQGTRDSLCPLDLLTKVLRRMKTPHRLRRVPDGDHSLTVTKRQLKASGKTQEQVDRSLLVSIRDFIKDRLRPGKATVDNLQKRQRLGRKFCKVDDFGALIESLSFSYHHLLKTPRTVSPITVA
jgi:predicted alpha/beta-hydrolase family hydrolase